MSAFDLLAGLVIEDDRRWGSAATEIQRDDARAILEGSTPYHFITRPRGASKTGDASGIATTQLRTLPPQSRLYWLASDVDQGALALDAIAGYVERTPGLRDEIEVQSRRVVSKQTGSRLEVLAADAASSWGLKPAAVYVDEFAQWAETRNARRLWESVSSSVLKVPGARLVVITTAGDPRSLAAKVIEHARHSELWRVSEMRGPGAPWTDPELLAEQRARLPAAVYEQLFENRWTEAEGAFLSPEALDACFDLPGAAVRSDHRWRYRAGLDLGHTHDRSALAIGHREPNGVHLDRLVVWSGTRREPVSFAMVEDGILAAHERFKFRLSADPWQALHVVERLRLQGVRAREVAFTPARKQRLASTLLQAVNDRAVHLYPDDELRDELLALRVKQTPSGWTFDHDAAGHDDRATALALVLVACLEGPTPGSKRHHVRSARYADPFGTSSPPGDRGAVPLDPGPAAPRRRRVRSGGTPQRAGNRVPIEQERAAKSRPTFN